MNYESLQLVNYDGQQIPSGYLFGDISARIAITYLKSIGAPESAVDKVKEVEVNKILYGIEVVKAANTPSFIARDSKTGKVYGGGNKMSPTAATQISKFQRGEQLAEGWTVEPVQAVQGQQAPMAQQAVQQPQQAAVQQTAAQAPQQPQKVKPLKPKANKTPTAPAPAAVEGRKSLQISDRKDPTKVLCSMSYQEGASIVAIDKLGKLPNIWANLLAAVGSFDEGKDKLGELERMFNTAKSKLTLDISVIPEHLRDEIMAKVMDPSVHYSEILDIVSQRTGVDAGTVFNNNMSESLAKNLGRNLSDNLHTILNNSNFTSMINDKHIQTDTLERLFPVLARVVKQNDGTLPEDFEFSKEMFLINLNNANAREDLDLLVKGLSDNYVGISALFTTPPNFDGSQRSRYGDQKAVNILLFPIANLVATEEHDLAVSTIVNLVGKKSGMSPEAVKEAAESLVKKMKDKGKFEDYAHRTYDGADLISKKLASLHMTPEEDALLGFAVKGAMKDYTKPNKGKFLSKYGAKQVSGEYRDPAGALDRLNILTPSVKSSSDPVKTRRNVNMVAGMVIATIASFGGKSRESEWVKGQEHISKSLIAVNKHLEEPIHMADLIPFGKTSPFVCVGGDGQPSRMTYIGSDNSITTVSFNNSGEPLSMTTRGKDGQLVKTDVTADSAEFKQFMDFLSRDVTSLVDTHIINSERALASTILMNDPSLVDKLEIEKVDPIYTSPLFNQVQMQVASVVGGFVAAFMDAPVGNSRDTVLAGGISGKSPGAEGLKHLAGSAPEKLKAYITNPPQSLDEEIAFLKEIEPLVGKDAAQGVAKILSGGVMYDNTMKILSDPRAIRSLLHGQGLQAPEGVNPYQMAKITANIGKLDIAAFDFSSTFDKDVDAVGKAELVKEVLVHYISKSAEEEANRRSTAVGANYQNFGSVRRHSDSFEAVSSVGQVIAEIKRRPDTAVILDTAPVFGTSLNHEVTLNFDNGEQFTMGLRKNMDPSVAGGQLDMLGTTRNKVNRTMSIDANELKVSQDMHQVAEINASRQAGLALMEMINQENPDKLLIKSVMNFSSIYGKPPTSGKTPRREGTSGALAFDMRISSGTEFGADGNIGKGVLR